MLCLAHLQNWNWLSCLSWDSNLYLLAVVLATIAARMAVACFSMTRTDMDQHDCLGCDPDSEMCHGCKTPLSLQDSCRLPLSRFIRFAYPVHSQGLSHRAWTRRALKGSWHAVCHTRRELKLPSPVASEHQDEAAKSLTFHRFAWDLCSESLA